MATYANAERAKELIHDVARLNNQGRDVIDRIHDIRARLVALTQQQRDTITAAVSDMGYDPAEIQTILGKWEQVWTTKEAQGIVDVPIPRG